MTDESPWAAPGAGNTPTPPPSTVTAPGAPASGSGVVPPPPPPPPPGYGPSTTPPPAYGAAAPVATAPPGYFGGTSAQPPIGAPGWTPPPRPGLIPLRPLDLGTILGASFRVLRRNPKPTFGAGLLIQGIVYLVLVGVVGGVSFFALSRIDAATSENQGTIAAGSIGLIVLSALIPIFLSVAASALMQGIIVLEVARGTVAEKLTFRGLWRLAKGRVLALIGWTFVVGLAVIVAIAVLAGLVAAVVATLGNVGIAIGVLLGIFGGLGLVVLFVWLSTKLAMVPSVLMIERLRLGGAIRRSWSLTRGYFWKLFGIQLLVGVIIYVASQIVQAPLSFVTPLLTTLVDPNGQKGTTTIIAAVAITLIALILAVVISAITSVIQTSTTALLYLDLRIRKEGLDLELARYVEARQAGSDAVRDPYLPRETVPSAPAGGDSPWE